jgi:hypothetical protein
MVREHESKGATVAYVVKWIAVGQTKNLESPAAYRNASQAMDFACTVLKQKPASIWIEGPGGVRIERGVIVINCKARHRLSR